MEEALAQTAAAFLAPLESSLGGIVDVMLPLLNALVPLVVGIVFLRAGFGNGSLPAAAWDAIFTVVLARAAIEFWPQLMDWSIGTASQLSQIGGGMPATNPFEIASTGFALLGRAIDHAQAQIGYLPGIGWLLGLFVFTTGLLIGVAYLIISAISLSAFVEFYGAAIVLSPLLAFLPVGGFQGASFAPISFIMSATFRIAALGFIASYSSDLITTYALPPTSEAITWSQTMIAGGLSVLLLYMAYRLNNFINGILLGRPGWSGAGVLMGAISTAGSAVLGAATGGAAGAGGRIAGAAGGGGGAGAAGGGSGAVGTRSIPVNSRTR